MMQDDSQTQESIIDISKVGYQGVNRNQMVDYALDILLLAYRLNKVESISIEIVDLREHLINEIFAMSSKLTHLRKYNETDILRHRYCLCVFFDELVLRNEIFLDGLWINNTLSQRFFNEASGGNKFFDIIETWLQNPAYHKDALEFAYLCLILGYKGKYNMLENGEQRLLHLSENISSVLVPILNTNEHKAFQTAYQTSNMTLFKLQRRTWIYIITGLCVGVSCVIYGYAFLHIQDYNVEVAHTLWGLLQHFFRAT